MDFITKYNEYREKWERIDKIKEQISLCVAINMTQPKFEAEGDFWQTYSLRVMYSGKEFRFYFNTMNKKFNLPYIKDEIAYHILKWECKERGIEYPPRMNSLE